MSIYIYILILIAGLVLALIAGFQVTKIIYAAYLKNKMKEMRREAAGVNRDMFSQNFCCDGIAKKILIYLIKISYSMSFISDQT